MLMSIRDNGECIHVRLLPLLQGDTIIVPGMGNGGQQYL